MMRGGGTTGKPTESSPEPQRGTGAVSKTSARSKAGTPPRNRLSALAWPRLAFRPRGALAVPEFRAFWFGMIVSNVGSWMQIVAQGWLIVELTQSSFYLGLVGLVRAIPALSVTLIGGVLADRLDRRRVLILTQISAAVLALLLGVLDATGLVTIWHILAIAFLSSTVMAIDNPTRHALVPDLVGKENIASAVGLNSAAWNAAAVIGPAIAGVLIATISTAGAFMLNGVSYLAVVYAVWRMQPKPRRSSPQQTLLQNLTDGLRFMARDRRIWGLIALIGVPTFFGRPFIQLMPIFAREVLQTDELGYGMLMSATGFGALIGALSVGPLGRSQRKGLLLILITGFFGVSLALFAASPWFVPSLAILLFVGAAQTVMMGLTNTLLQFTVPEEMRGRVMSAYVLIPMGLMPLGSMLEGSIGAVITVPLTVGASAVIVVVFVAAVFRFMPDLRRLP